jgi:hypothetical protein
LNTKLSTCDEKRVFSDDDDTGNAWQEVGKKKGVEEDIGLLSGFKQTQEHLSLIKLKNPNQSELQKKLDRCPCKGNTDSGRTRKLRRTRKVSKSTIRERKGQDKLAR